MGCGEPDVGEPVGSDGSTESADEQIQALEARLAALEATALDDAEYAELAGLSDYLEVDRAQDAVSFVGVNVYVKSGAGATDGHANGVGNLVVGYDEGAGEGKGGSHNLVVGPGHRYSSYGGLVAGSENTLAGAYASVQAGVFNLASGYGASVSGGFWNTASGTYAAVSGSSSMSASDDYEYLP